MKVVALISGGKDSIYNCMKCVSHGHELVALAHMSPPPAVEELDSFTFQTIGSNLVQPISECLGLPVIIRPITGKAVDQGMHYFTGGQAGGQAALGGEVGAGDAGAASTVAASSPRATADPSAADADEVEDLYELLAEVKRRHPDVEAVSSGAVLSSYQRHRVEDVCRRLGLVSLAYLWQRDQGELLREMVDAGVEAVVVKVAAMGLHAKHVGRTIGDLQPLFRKLNAQFGFHICGEGGEYETIAVDCPLFRRRLVFDESEVRMHDSDDVHLLVVNKFHTEPKDGESGGGDCGRKESEESEESNAAAAPGTASASAPSTATEKKALSVKMAAPAAAEPVEAKADAGDHGQSAATAACVVPGWPAHSVGRRGHVVVSGLVGPGGPTEAPEGTQGDTQAYWLERVKKDTIVLMEALRETLERAGCTMADVCYVHLVIRDMSWFGATNAEYCRYFGRCPPSRSCVELALPGGATVALDCVALQGSGRAMAEADGTVPLPADLDAKEGEFPLRRNVLHVQSMSEWAPVCIGPYSQANVVDGLLLVAGQIALDPPTMGMAVPRPVGGVGGGDALHREAALSLRHIERVLQCLGSKLSQSLSCVTYISREAAAEAGLALAGEGGNTLGEGATSQGALGDAAAAQQLASPSSVVAVSSSSSPKTHSWLWKFCARQWRIAVAKSADGLTWDAPRDAGEDAAALAAVDPEGVGPDIGRHVPPMICVIVPSLPRAARIEFEVVAMDNRQWGATASARTANNGVEGSTGGVGGVGGAGGAGGDGTGRAGGADGDGSSAVLSHHAMGNSLHAHNAVTLIHCLPNEEKGGSGLRAWAEAAAAEWFARVNGGSVRGASWGGWNASIRVFYAASTGDDASVCMAEGTGEVRVFVDALRTVVHEGAVSGGMPMPAISCLPVDHLGAAQWGAGESGGEGGGEGGGQCRQARIGVLLSLSAVGTPLRDSML